MRSILRNLKQKLKWVIWKIAPRPGLWKRDLSTQDFSIAIYQGKSLLSLGSSDSVENPVLTRLDVTDIPANFVADPFFCQSNNRWYMFFEVLNQINSRGEIGLAESDNGLDWCYRQIVLTEPYHLSYPCVFKWDDDFYMIPEGGRGAGVTLYKADRFPLKWLPIKVIIENTGYFDSSIFRYQQLWWLFTATKDSNKKIILQLYYAKDLLGLWEKHPESPIQEANQHTSRPGGRVVVDGDKLYRFAQDGYPIYGSKVHIMEIIKLSKTEYKEKRIDEHPFLEAGRNHWNSGGMHHIDPHQLQDGSWIACVDGFPAR